MNTLKSRVSWRIESFFPIFSLHQLFKLVINIRKIDSKKKETTRYPYCWGKWWKHSSRRTKSKTLRKCYSILSFEINSIKAYSTFRQDFPTVTVIIISNEQPWITFSRMEFYKTINVLTYFHFLLYICNTIKDKLKIRRDLSNMNITRLVLIFLDLFLV